MYVSDLRHFLDIDDDAPTPARRMATQLFHLVRAGTSGPSGTRWLTAIRCRRRPGHRACPGHLQVRRGDIPAEIEWQCSSCGDQGVIHGWQDSSFDLRHSPGTTEQPARRVPLPEEVMATLQDLLHLDPACDRAIAQAVFSDQDSRPVVVIGEDDLEELVGVVAFEGNHEPNRSRRKRLDAAFQVLNDALENGVN